MKAGRIIDFVVQSFIAAITLAACVWHLVNGNVEQIGVAALGGAMFLGPWQVVSCVVTLIANSPFRKERLIHLLSAIVYLILFSFTVSVYDRIDPPIAVSALIFAIPTFLAGFYLNITYRSLRWK